MENTSRNCYYFVTNLVAGLSIFILNVRFSVAYVSYFWIISFLYLIYCVWYGRINRIAIVRICRTDWTDLKILIAGIFIFYGLLLVSGLLLGDKSSMKTAVEWFLYACPFFVFFILSGSYNINKGIAVGIFLAIIANAILGESQLIGDNLYNPGGVRIQGSFNHPNSFGSVLAWTIPFVGYFLYRSKTTSQRVFALFVLVLSFLCLFLTDSRGAAVSLITGLVVTALIYALVHRNQLGIRQKLAVVFLCLVLAVGTGAVLNSSVHNTRGLGERQLMWSSSMQMWEDHKLLGVGIGRWPENYYSERYHPAEGHEMGHYFPHNMPIYFLSGAGILGGIGYLCLVLSMLYVLLKRAIESDGITSAIPMMAVFIAFIMDGMIDATLTNKTVGIPFYALLGYAIGTFHTGREH